MEKMFLKMDYFKRLNLENIHKRSFIRRGQMNWIRKSISVQEQKQIMLEMLRFIDEICRKNKIKYSLFAGTLIGAVRHRGYIPWDDDIDIILTKKNYEKLKRILDKETGRYQTLKFGKGGERFAFVKLIDTYTRAMERTQLKDDPYYGVYIDVFCYYSTSNIAKERLRHYKRIKFLIKITARLRIDFENRNFIQNAKQWGKNTISKILGYRMINRLFDRTMNRYEGTDYVISNWPAYGFEKEIQLKKNTEKYIDAEFEGLKVMIFKNYDEILRTTFGDYMQLPSESERVPKHNMTMWWREGHEGEAEKLKAEIEKCKSSGIGNARKSEGGKQERTK